MQHLLIDSAAGICCEDFRYESGSWRVELRTLRGGVRDGVQIVEVDNGNFSVVVCPTRGMGIHHLRRGDRLLGWRSPILGPVHPQFVPLHDPTGFGWLEGFDELMCRCGLLRIGPPEFDDRGNLLQGLHGRIANLPAHKLVLDHDEDRHELSLTGVIDEGKFHFHHLRLTTTLCIAPLADEITWTDHVQNLSRRKATMQMLYHVNIGEPFLTTGATIAAPFEAVAPFNLFAAEAGMREFATMPSPSGSAEQVYLCRLRADHSDRTIVILRNSTETEAVSLRYSRKSLPCFTIWRNPAASEDGYVVGLEPGTSYPNPKSFEGTQGRVIELGGGEEWKSEVTLGWHDQPNRIAELAGRVTALQAAGPPIIHSTPQVGWSL
jgi:hypothetical protein